MAIVCEIALKELFRLQEGLEPPGDYGWLAKWYEKREGKFPTYLNLTRREINDFKHGPRKPSGIPRKVETMPVALKAFRELQDLLGCFRVPDSIS
jgi:hypothetical protein